MNALTVINPLPIADVERVALAIAKGGLFGSTDPNAVLTLCLLAQAEGQHPAVVFRDYHIIKGKPAKKADAMLRDFVSAGGKVEWHKLDDAVADATFSHAGGGTVRIDWTLKRAQQAGLTTDMWRKYPRQMLRSRVISEGVRTVYPGATSGLYEVGEVQDIVAEVPRQLEASPAPPPEPASEKRQPPLKGPIKTRAAVRIAYGNFCSELEACADEDMLEALLDAEAPLIEQIRDEAPFLRDGDGADFLGLNREIDRRRGLIAMEPPSYGDTGIRDVGGEPVSYLAAG